MTTTADRRALEGYASAEHLRAEHDRLDRLETSLRAHLSRTIIRAEIDRQTREDEALAALRALGDDGTALRQAVALAACGVTDDALEHALARWAREGTL